MAKPTQRLAPPKATLSLPKTLSYTPDRKDKVRWFAGSKSDENAQRKRVTDAILKLNYTEHELIERGFTESRYSTIEEFIGAALQMLAKTSIMNASGSDVRYQGAYGRLKRAGDTNITPAKLAVEAEGNFRSAKTWLERNGYTWVSRPRAVADKQQGAA